jgi:hypothetical protein
LKKWSVEKSARQQELAIELNVPSKTISNWLSLVTKNKKHVFLPSSGRPNLNSPASVLASQLAMRNQRQGSLRTDKMSTILTQDAKATARARGKPSHSITFSESTRKRRVRDVAKLQVAERKAQVKDDVRIESEDSPKNFLAHYTTGVMTTLDTHGALCLNTDKTVISYNFDQDR